MIYLRREKSAGHFAFKYQRFLLRRICLLVFFIVVGELKYHVIFSDKRRIFRSYIFPPRFLYLIYKHFHCEYSEGSINFAFFLFTKHSKYFSLEKWPFFIFWNLAVRLLRTEIQTPVLPTIYTSTRNRSILENARSVKQALRDWKVIDRVQVERHLSVGWDREKPRKFASKIHFFFLNIELRAFENVQGAKD